MKNPTRKNNQKQQVKVALSALEVRFMKMKKLICLFSLFLLSGCGNVKTVPPPEGLFLDVIGKYKLGNVGYRDVPYENENNKNQQFQAWRALYSENEKRIIYNVGVHQNPENAANEVKFLTDCFDSNRKLRIENKFLEKIPVKDKSGKQVGTMSTCLTRKDNEYQKDGLDNYNYTFAFSQENRTHSFSSLESSSAQRNAEMLEFLKSLPFASQLDLLILERFEPTAGKSLKYEDLFDNPPPVKLAAKPYLKDKILVIEKSPIDKDDRVVYIINAAESYIQNADRQAWLPSDVGSILRINCKKGNQLGDYEVKGTKVPAFGAVCEVSVSDEKIPAIIAKKTFTDNDLPEMPMIETDKKGKVKNIQYIIPFPKDEIRKYLEGLPAN